MGRCSFLIGRNLRWLVSGCGFLVKWNGQGRPVKDRSTPPSMALNSKFELAEKKPRNCGWNFTSPLKRPRAFMSVDWSRSILSNPALNLTPLSASVSSTTRMPRSSSRAGEAFSALFSGLAAVLAEEELQNRRDQSPR